MSIPSCSPRWSLRQTISPITTPISRRCKLWACRFPMRSATRCFNSPWGACFNAMCVSAHSKMCDHNRKRSLIPAALLTLAISGYGQQSLAATPSAPAAGQQKIAIMSLQGVLVGTNDGKKANQELTAKYEPKKKEFDQRQNEIAQEEDQLRKSGNVMSEEKRNELQRDIDEKKRRLQRDMQDAEEELQNEQQQILQKLGQRVMAVVTKYAKDNGYTMVLDDSNPSTPILYASSAVDITQDIIDLYNKTSVDGGPVTTPSVPSPGTPGKNAAPAGK